MFKGDFSKMKRAVEFVSVVVCAMSMQGCLYHGDRAGVDLSPRAIAAAEAAGCKATAGEELRIYTWSDYIAPEVIAGFENGLGVKVVIDTFDSNEDMYASLKADGVKYDIMMPSSYQIAQMVNDGMIDELDSAKCPNLLKNFDKSYACQVVDPSFWYNAPYAVTYTGFMYLKSKIPQGADANSLSILDNPALNGRIILLDDMREVIGIGLISLGYSVNSTNPREIDAAVAQVLKWRRNISKFDAESYKAEVPSGASWLGQGYSSDVMQVIVSNADAGDHEHDDVRFSLPKEGFTITFDEMVIAKNSKHKDLAYAFINYIYDGEVAKANMERICCINPVKPGIDALEPKYRALIIPDDATIRRGQLIRGFADDPEAMELYNKAWSKIRAAEGR